MRETRYSTKDRVVILPSEDDTRAWRREVRQLLMQGVEPSSTIWRIEGEHDLFADKAPSTASDKSSAVRLPKSAVALAQTAIHHSDRDRFGLLYRFLWRSQTERGLVDNRADPDAIAVHRLAKAVRRDAHKMHAFVRFRKVGEENGRERFAAWFEPDHHIVEREAPFFVRRFANMDWVIATPRKTALYQNGSVRFAPGGSRNDVPPDDAFEEAWCAYYEHIFNPARIMTDAMRAEMPKKYWKNLPEAHLIPQLLEKAPARVAAMQAVAQSAPPPLDLQRPEQQINPAIKTLEHLNEAVRRCASCSLCGEASQAVCGEGPAATDVFMIGEQPGHEEDLSGKPFVGPAGQVLNQHLHRAGLDRSSLYLTNAVKHFKFQRRGKRRIHQSPNTSEIKACTPLLYAEHRIVKPKITVTLGTTALRALTGKPMALSRVRGEALNLSFDWGDTVLIPTFHPSYLLRLKDEGQRQVETRKFAADLARAAQLAKVAA